MPAQLLIVDPQNDFCDIRGAALPVAGADADMARLARFIGAAGTRLDDILVTLDTHPSVAIERPGFWISGTCEPVAPFTVVTATQVRSGAFVPRDPQRLDEAIRYLDALEAGGKYNLMIWPTHCVLGTWGHNIHAAVAGALADWELASQRPAEKILKGMNPMTEQYSAVRAEVPRADDARTQTNRALVDRVAQSAGWTFIAGEASSHCVSATVRDLFAAMGPDKLARTVLLVDCMSPVAGFESAQEAFYAEALKLGVRRVDSAQALDELLAP